MSEYIKKEEEIECLEAMKKANMNFDDRYIYAKVIQQVKDMPTTDVVEVVRCKDCKHHEELLNNNDGKVLCWVHGLDVVVDESGYCNYGERKEQEHE